MENGQECGRKNIGGQGQKGLRKGHMYGTMEVGRKCEKERSLYHMVMPNREHQQQSSH